MANVQVQNPAGYDILNYGQGLSLQDLNLFSAMDSDNTLLVSQSIYCIPFTSSIKQSLLGIQGAGFWYFDGSNYILQIRPDSTFSNGTYQLDVYCYYFRSACIDSGSIKVYNS